MAGQRDWADDWALDVGTSMRAAAASAAFQAASQALDRQRAKPGPRPEPRVGDEEFLAFAAKWEALDQLTLLLAAIERGALPRIVRTEEDAEDPPSAANRNALAVLRRAFVEQRKVVDRPTAARAGEEARFLERYGPFSLADWEDARGIFRWFIHPVGKAPALFRPARSRRRRPTKRRAAERMRRTTRRKRPSGQRYGRCAKAAAPRAPGTVASRGDLRRPPRRLSGAAARSPHGLGCVSTVRQELGHHVVEDGRVLASRRGDRCRVRSPAARRAGRVRGRRALAATAARPPGAADQEGRRADRLRVRPAMRRAPPLDLAEQREGVGPHSSPEPLSQPPPCPGSGRRGGRTRRGRVRCRPGRCAPPRRRTGRSDCAWRMGHRRAPNGIGRRGRGARRRETAALGGGR